MAKSKIGNEVCSCSGKGGKMPSNGMMYQHMRMMRGGGSKGGYGGGRFKGGVK